jgi:hypothetical protein
LWPCSCNETPSPSCIGFSDLELHWTAHNAPSALVWLLASTEKPSQCIEIDRITDTTPADTYKTATALTTTVTATLSITVTSHKKKGYYFVHDHSFTMPLSTRSTVFAVDPNNDV